MTSTDDDKGKTAPADETKADGLDLEQLLKLLVALLPSKKKNSTYLDWAGFSFRMTDDNQLIGDDNWEMWKTSFWVAITGTGYQKGDEGQLTHIDEAKIAGAIVSNVKKGPLTVVAGLSKGTEMYYALNKAYGHHGID